MCWGGQTQTGLLPPVLQTHSSPPLKPSKSDSSRDTVIPELPVHQSVRRVPAQANGVTAHLLTTQKHAGNARCSLAGEPIPTVCSPRSKGQSAFRGACNFKELCPAVKLVPLQHTDCTGPLTCAKQAPYPLRATKEVNFPEELGDRKHTEHLNRLKANPSVPQTPPIDLTGGTALPAQTEYMGHQHRITRCWGHLLQHGLENAFFFFFAGIQCIELPGRWLCWSVLCRTVRLLTTVCPGGPQAALFSAVGGR